MTRFAVCAFGEEYFRRSAIAPNNPKQLPNGTLTSPQPQMSKPCVGLNDIHENDSMIAEHDLQRAGLAFIGGLGTNPMAEVFLGSSTVYGIGAAISATAFAAFCK